MGSTDNKGNAHHNNHHTVAPSKTYQFHPFLVVGLGIRQSAIIVVTGTNHPNVTTEEITGIFILFLLSVPSLEEKPALPIPSTGTAT